jgi:predicted transcriptional regulator
MNWPSRNPNVLEGNTLDVNRNMLEYDRNDAIKLISGYLQFIFFAKISDIMYRIQMIKGPE